MSTLSNFFVYFTFYNKIKALVKKVARFLNLQKKTGFLSERRASRVGKREKTTCKAPDIVIMCYELISPTLRFIGFTKRILRSNIGVLSKG